jgi:hypothetical protein
VLADYEAKIAALERKVAQLTMEPDLLKKAPKLRLVSGSENSSIVSGSKAAPSDGVPSDRPAPQHLLLPPEWPHAQGRRCSTGRADRQHPG